ncbi:MAG TPA: bifunctional ADP-dependent NAD(P)H-hydrate dehydratase/NAD(P)H-hydrate epimerase [Pseudomonas sp.]|uniref:NAD(P)H-hydrate dehydratase n=1 Tax=Stutzerimonas xanthomarina TaxID=271420 RepID=UPI000E7E9BA7|nr:NAD(P)H-hydrate dehydratase [Stutzerimonas xanthomarina]MBU0850752.1 NAD(P)H-hydrate dehydratase [Gammaproteobacteria bacterium]HAQ87393.1 bifunctional ADP-dependent NAD(P)H-hydrate dehydratase/NAD(P)H-hydrate epimerase [Pseudomonas sp.]MBK3845343.1 NAD(P)H-hydrate dehydratase [Stutzerimonas xanthomarina]MBK3846220.1 NAD(P)H-hydrate dehydratase [Stutzerimonas xanthomarina]MBU1301527.1 NAD(P)H-hydrate dehydratase [Gammaproteobacteria bacterium]|tara:strand:- start:5963 stop:7462 length:1500 start_codon:yes stop_codon:yes gene_type:complete
MSQTTDTLPVPLYSAAQVRELDARLIAAGTPGYELMQRAAHAAWRALRRRWPDADEISVLAGRGNNAGDGYLIAALAQRAGRQVRVFAVGDPQQLQGDAAQAFAEAQAAGVEVTPWAAGTELRGVLVDALLGTGIAGEVREPYASAIRAMNESAQPILSVDLPSGLCADTGHQLGDAVRAELTVTFIGLKLGLFTGQGPDCFGALVFDDLQADAEVVAQIKPSALRLCEANLPTLAPRSPTAHKGSFGQVLVIGGDLGTGGAALLSAEAALRCGAGMVTLATRPEHVTASLVRRPEIMCNGVESTYALTALTQRADVLVIGPGLGQAPWGRSLLSLAPQCRVPQVWDADALNLLATGAVELPSDCLLTPHPGEAARLLGISVADVQADRPAAARALAARFGCAVLLKGAGTLIADHDGRLALCDRGHPAMASAGLGDVLAGVAGALLAQGLAPFEAACLAVWLHAVAGERLGAGGRGLVAADLIPMVRQLLEEHSPCLN